MSESLDKSQNLDTKLKVGVNIIQHTTEIELKKDSHERKRSDEGEQS